MTVTATAAPAPFPTLKDLSLDAIRLDGGTQPRASIDAGTVAEYAERMQAGDHFPPVQVYFDGTDHWLSDGFHRVHAARKAGMTTIQAEVWEGTRDDAFWMSLAANRGHGLRRTNEDKTRAVKQALSTRPDLSNRQIADHIGVCEAMVRNHRAETGAHDAHLTTRTGRDGKQYPARGTKKPADAPPDPDDIPMDPAEETAAEAVAAEGPVTDRLGHPVEGKVAEAFRRRHEIQALMLAVTQIKSKVLKAIEAKDPLYADILPSRFQADCGNVFRQLKAALPHAACPYCRAAGCKACSGRGWIGEVAYDVAPREIK